MPCVFSWFFRFLYRVTFRFHSRQPANDAAKPIHFARTPNSFCVLFYFVCFLYRTILKSDFNFTYNLSHNRFQYSQYYIFAIISTISHLRLKTEN